MSAPASRRGFLRGLTTLPLIGGGVALIGSPTAVAAPVTDALLARYIDWLATEYGEALIERDVRREPQRAAIMDHYRRGWCQDNLTLNSNPHSGRFAKAPTLAPSTRAALVLSAVGNDWRGGAA